MKQATNPLRRATVAPICRSAISDAVLVSPIARRFAPQFRHVALLSLATTIAGCASFGATSSDNLSSFVVLGEGGAAVARVISSAARCPAITRDGRNEAMTLRATPQTLPLRATQSPPQESKPSAFPVLTCEALIPAGTRTLSVAGKPLPIPAPVITRIVVIGDTGCRLKRNGSYQDCNNPEAFPFAQVAAAAAAWKPQLVVHVGDYHYREDPCPASRPGCAGSPWGYGWDTWKADLFAPGKVLLEAAPWVVVRGNHESCARAGQGFWRFLDPRPLVHGRDCNSTDNDGLGDYSDPYAVPLGGSAQLIVLDTSKTTYKGLAPDDIRRERYADAYRKFDALSRGAQYTIGLTHHPILAFGAATNTAGVVTLFGGDAGLQDAFGAINPGLLPAGVSAMLSGHVHLWEQVSFSSGHPTQFVAGFSGTEEDSIPLPATAQADLMPAPGAIVEHMSSWVDGFGFMTMERIGPKDWSVKVHDKLGAVTIACDLKGKTSSCSKARTLESPPLSTHWVPDK